MTVAFDAAFGLRQGFGQSSTHLHTPVVSIPDAIYVLIAVNSVNDLFTGVTYGGVAMTRVGRFVNGGAASQIIYKLQSGIPSGPKNVVATTSNWEDWYIVSFSVTSADPIDVISTESMNNFSTTNPSIVLPTPSGFDGLVMAILRNTGHTAGAGYTLVPPAGSGGANATAEYGVKTGANVVADFIATLNNQHMAAIAVGMEIPEESNTKAKVGGVFVDTAVSVKVGGVFIEKSMKTKSGGIWTP